MDKPTPPTGGPWADEPVDAADGQFDRSRPAKYHRIPSEEEMKDFPYFPKRYEGEPLPGFEHRVFRFWKNYFRGQKRKELRAAKAAGKAQNNPGSSQGVKRVRSVGNKSSQPDKRRNTQNVTNVGSNPKGQPARQRGTYANAAATRNRGTAEPHKLFVHSIVDGDEKAPLEPEMWIRIKTRLLATWFDMEPIMKAKIRIKETYQGRNCGTVVPADEVSSQWARDVIVKAGGGTVSVWDQSSYKMTLITTHVTEEVKSFGAAKVIKSALDLKGIKTTLFVKSEIFTGKGYIIRYLVQNEAVDKIKAIGCRICTGLLDLELRLPKSHEIRELEAQTSGLTVESGSAAGASNPASVGGTASSSSVAEST